MMLSDERLSPREIIMRALAKAMPHFVAQGYAPLIRSIEDDLTAGGYEIRALSESSPPPRDVSGRSVSHAIYGSAVAGRQEFRKAYRREREENRRIRFDVLHLIDLAACGSCSCDTKTHEYMYHDKLCPYRVLQELRVAIEATIAKAEPTGSEAVQQIAPEQDWNEKCARCGATYSDHAYGIDKTACGDFTEPTAPPEPGTDQSPSGIDPVKALEAFVGKPRERSEAPSTPPSTEGGEIVHGSSGCVFCDMDLKPNVNGYHVEGRFGATAMCGLWPGHQLSPPPSPDPLDKPVSWRDVNATMGDLASLAAAIEAPDGTLLRIREAAEHRAERTK